MRVARIFNTYGPRMHMFDGEPLHIQVKYCCVLLTLLCVHGGLHAGRVVSNFIMQALQGKSLTVSCVKEVHWRGRWEVEGGGRRLRAFLILCMARTSIEVDGIQLALR